MKGILKEELGREPTQAELEDATLTIKGEPPAEAADLFDDLGGGDEVVGENAVPTETEIKDALK